MSIVIKSLAYTHPDREILFENINLSISKGDNAALVGNNGAGKSTLLQLIAGRLKPTAGEIILPEKAYYVPQHLGQYDDLLIAEALQVDKKLKALHAILEGDASPGHFTNLDDDWDIEEKVEIALASWQLAHLDLRQTMATLSGGEKTKVFLAGILIQSPEIILLDEPTNHIDAAGREQLYNFITKSKATILVVSHDRALLNLPAITLELDKSGVELFGGNYAFYKEQKEGILNALQSRLDENEKSLKQARQKARDITEQRQKKEVRGKARGQSQSLPRIIAGGLKRKAEQSTAKLQNTHNEKVNDILDNVKQTRFQLQQYQVLKIDLKRSGLHKGKVLVDAQDINFSYAQTMLWQPLSFQVRSGSRVRIEGNNGSGKTTLIKIMMGILRPTIGEIYIAGFNYLYLDQDYTLIDNQLTVFEQVQKFNGRNLPEHELKSLLHYYQFPNDVWNRKCMVLSGGEKMKLMLCSLVIGNNTPDMLILDEPTNNLDVQSLEVFTLAMRNFNGTLLVISHDRYFIEEMLIDTCINLDE